MNADQSFEFTQYRCRCGYIFEESLGKYGCPNCGGAMGAAKPIFEKSPKKKPGKKPKS